MAKLTLPAISSGFTSTTTLNSNNDLIEAALENTLSRDGTSPNQMEANLDMNSKEILNIEKVHAANYFRNGVLVNFGTPTNSTTNNVYEHTVVSGDTPYLAYTLGFEYVLASSNIQVFINGVQQRPSSYTETSTTVITFSEALEVGDELVVWLI